MRQFIVTSLNNLVSTVKKEKRVYSGTIPTPTIKKGSSGIKVKNLQKFLNWYGNYKLVVDGICGVKTVNAIKSFQSKEKITKDGIYGKVSYSKAQNYKQKTDPKVNTSLVVDVSYWQHTINWTKVAKANVKGVILRTSYTSQNKFSLSDDSTFVSNLNNAIKNGIRIGAYHYSQAISVTEAKKEAEYICKKIQPYKDKITLPVVCDWEFGGRLSSKKAKSLGKVKCTEIIEAFCDVVSSKGFTPMVYANYSTFSDYLDYARLKKNYLIWLAQYSSKASLEYDMWQYSSSGNINGITGKTDVNIAKANVFKQK